MEKIAHETSRKIHMKKIYNRVLKRTIVINDAEKRRRNIVAHAMLSIGYWIAASFLRVPGLFFHLYSSFLGFYLLVKARLDKKMIGRMILFPMDSVRYFEFDFCWRSFSAGDTLGYYLDVSSPRLFSLRALNKHPFERAVLINPVADDLRMTEQLIHACGLSSRCEFRNCLLEELDSAPASFDTIVSVSVIEHIPGEGDREAIKKMWELLSPRGRLLLSVPCAREAFEEYLDFNEYGLLAEDENHFVFGQRFYNQILLQERIYCITGSPSRFAVYGEKKIDTFKENREKKLKGSGYPYWREPFMMGMEYKYFDSIADLPGWGVAAMEFVKQ